MFNQFLLRFDDLKLKCPCSRVHVQCLLLPFFLLLIEVRVTQELAGIAVTVYYRAMHYVHSAVLRLHAMHGVRPSVRL